MDITLDIDKIGENKYQYITIGGIILAIVVLYFVFIK
jgi:hypothetical protein